ncbi:multiubiquitin domain-containing protein [Flavobacterium chryseum]|uniref:multiubiquitin domain-containing protein n=1 Tax=Flavobacterium sp. P3160 TaxID=2512113 RepID=UPI00105D616A|nr:multiubiquitin domain-containing protein [Flavobacterium sp. P3160]
MENINGAKDAQKLKQPLEFIIEGEKFETFDQYKTGIELKQLKGIPLETELYLSIAKPYKDELIENDKSVNLARPDKEYFFVKKKLHFTINKEPFVWYKQFIRGIQVRELGKINPEEDLYLDLPEGYEDDFITDDEIVDLARQGKESFFSVKKDEPQLVQIEINTKQYQISKGIHTVMEIKKLGSVPMAHELEQLIHGKLTPLDDNSSVLIKGSEKFFSHVRDGSSS